MRAGAVGVPEPGGDAAESQERERAGTRSIAPTRSLVPLSSLSRGEPDAPCPSPPSLTTRYWYSERRSWRSAPFTAFLMSLSALSSHSATNVIATPSRPARAVRPMRWMYDSLSSGMS